MRTSTTLAGLMLAMGTFALPADANGLAARADPFQQGGQQQQQGQFGQAPQQQQQGQFGQGYGQQGQNNRGPGGYYDPNYNYQNRPQIDVGCAECDKYSHHAYENSNTKSTHTHCENGCCKPEPKPEPCPKPEPPCPKPEPPCPKPQPKPCEPGCTKPCCQGKYPFGYGEKRA